MDFEKKSQCTKSEKFKFNECFTRKFDKLAKAYDEELKHLRTIDKEIKNLSHGVCNNAYRLRYITPSDISTFVSNLDKSLAAGMIKPTPGDCNMFAVMSAKKFIEANGCVPFEKANGLGNTKGTLPKGTDLGDLEMLVGYEVFGRDVYTKHEMSTRINLIKDDVKKLDNMHFTAAVRSLISKLPTIIEKHSETACCCCDVKSKEMLALYVCHFVMFATKLNLMCIEQMIQYAVPKVTFDTKEDREGKITDSTVVGFMEMYAEDGEELVQEAVNTDEKKPIYFVFSKGIAPVLSKAIMNATHSEFSHVGISFDADCRKIYTYTARGERHENYVSGETGFGFTIDSIKDLADQDIEVAVVVGFIDNKKIDIIKDQIEDFASHKTKFDATLFVNYLRDKPASNKNKYAQVCSTFCDYVLRTVDIKISDENLPSPGGIKNTLDRYAESLNNVFELYTGKADKYVPETAEAEASKFAAREFARPFDEMFTECFHVTKVGSEIRSIVPFNCNFRDIVLGDDHEFYKNTACALDYITTNPASPFHQILVQFTPDECPSVTAVEVESLMRMMFGERLHCSEGLDDPYHRPDVQFPSDPNWMDKIAFGNAYYDMNYRRDNPGNYKMDPITTKLDMIYKMYGHVHHETDSTKLASNVKKIVAIMKAIIGERKLADEWHMPRLMSTEMLAVFGDILTKTLLKLYHLNTTVITYGDNMEKTMIPGYMESYNEIIETEDGSMIQESYIIQEADTPTVGKMEVKASSDDNLKGFDKAKNTMSKWFAKVRKFFDGIFGHFFSNWEKVLEKRIAWLDKPETKKAIDNLCNALDSGSFALTIPEYYPFKVKVDELGSVDPGSKLKAAIDGNKEDYANKEKIDELEKSCYPADIAESLIGSYSNATNGSDGSKATAENNTKEARAKIMKNWVLFGVKAGEQIPVQKDKKLDSSIVREIYDDLTKTKTGIAPVFKKINDSLKTANTDIEKTLSETERAQVKAATDGASAQLAANSGNGTDKDAKNDKNESQEANTEYSGAVQIALAANRVQSIFSLASMDAIIGNPKNNQDMDAYENSFWGIQFDLLTKILTEFKSREGKTSSSSAASNNATATAAAETPAAQ